MPLVWYCLQRRRACYLAEIKPAQVALQAISTRLVDDTAPTPGLVTPLTL